LDVFHEEDDEDEEEDEEDEEEDEEDKDKRPVDGNNCFNFLLIALHQQQKKATKKVEKIFIL
jgi:hypothetical protein